MAKTSVEVQITRVPLVWVVAKPTRARLQGHGLPWTQTQIVPEVPAWKVLSIHPTRYAAERALPSGTEYQVIEWELGKGPVE